MYRYILFDLDGTLTDPGEGITNSVAYALEQFGIPTPDRKALYPFIGPPLLDSFAKYYGMGEADAQRALYEYRVYFRARGIFENALYPKTVWLLQQLRAAGKQILLATSKPEEFAEQILAHFELRQYFDCVAGASMDEARSKKSDVIAYALQKAGITNTNEAVMVGDRHHDVVGARENGLSAIGVLWGYGDEAELREAGAAEICRDMDELASILRKTKGDV